MLIHHDTHGFKHMKEMDVLTRRAKDLSVTTVFECSHTNKTGCPCGFVLWEDQTENIVGEHARYISSRRQLLVKVVQGEATDS